MDYIPITAYILALRFMGIKEIAGNMDNPQIMAMLKLNDSWPIHDEVPWCSAFVNYICWLLHLPRSKSLLARSWLHVGCSINLDTCLRGFDIVILDRTGGQDRASVKAPGHVGFYAARDLDSIYLLGGNQRDSVNISKYALKDILGIRRLYPGPN